MRKTHHTIGGNPHGRTTPDVITPRQQEVLDQVGRVPIRAAEIARHVQRSPKGVTSTLYALEGHGLVERIPGKGWRRPQTRQIA